MKTITSFVTLFVGLTLTVAAHAQDFLQQWRDSAAAAQKDFRTANTSTITQRGWRFLEGFSNADGVPLADLFVKDVKRENEAVRSAHVLTAFYQPASAPDGTQYRASRSELSFDCAGKHVQQRAASYFDKADATGEPAASQSEAGPQMRDPDPHTAEPALLAAICAMQL